jgi:hypothetical protein
LGTIDIQINRRRWDNNNLLAKSGLDQEISYRLKVNVIFWIQRNARLLGNTAGCRLGAKGKYFLGTIDYLDWYCPVYIDPEVVLSNRRI